MAITTILFDLDGTLLPMDQERFVQAYLGGLAKKAAPYGYEPQKLLKTIWHCIDAMVKNNGSQSNETVFWNAFTQVFGADARKDEVVFQDFYQKEFQRVQTACGFQPLARPLLDMLKKKGLRIILATNPLFPRIATESRIRWAGLEPEDFILYTTYENSCRCKPDLAYYQEILDALQLSADQCMMIGNDVDEDMIAAQLGMEVFLLTDCLISRQSPDLDRYPHGNFQQLFDFLSQLPSIS